MSKLHQILIYQTKDGITSLEVNLEKETVWLSQKQMGKLFERGIPTINEHIKNIFKEEELTESSVIRKFRITATDGKTYQTNHYNLDVIISVGYRVKSKRGTQFRIWATNILKNYLVEGYAINQKRLKESEEKYQQLQKVLCLAANVSSTKPLSSEESNSILRLLEEYAYALETLDKYDHQQLETDLSEEKEIWKLSYEEAVYQIALWKAYQKAGDLFGNEKDKSFKSSLETIYQTFDGVDLYPSIEEKAANLLYFIVKNHSFTDGNKRIAAGLFVWFLAQNKKLFRADGSKRIGDNALVAMTIMIAESKSVEKDMMVKLVVNLINYKN